MNATSNLSNMNADHLAAQSTAVPVPAPAPAPGKDDGSYQWTVGTICLSIALFLFAALAEVGGGWLVWQTIRENKAWWMAVLGSLVLIGYGFIPTLQPTDSFGRIYAVYGGFFVVFSYAWGWLVDGDKPDLGDWIGTAIAITGVLLAWFWPR